MDQGASTPTGSESRLSGSFADSYPPMPLGRPSQAGEPTWELASLFPNQGSWTEIDYLDLDRSHRRLYELVDGQLEVLAMPTVSHQDIALYLYRQLDGHVRERKLGKALVAPCPVRLDTKHYREPDVFFIRPERLIRDGQPEGADLVMEVVSPGERERKRDLETKPVAYAKAGISEYWIVDPLEQRITVLALEVAAYRTAGVYAPGDTARSVLLPGFEVDVAEAFTAGA